MKFPLWISEPKNYDNSVVYIHDADNVYIGYFMCPEKADAIKISEVLKKWSTEQALDKQPEV
jgi:hypothetical protein